jgi:hypothetical protein
MQVRGHLGSEASLNRTKLQRFLFVRSLSYRLKMHLVKSNVIGNRFRMSRLGSARSPILAGKEGIIIGDGRYYRSVRVRFDGNKSPTTLHLDYIELIPLKPDC